MKKALLIALAFASLGCEQSTPWVLWVELRGIGPLRGWRDWKMQQPFESKAACEKERDRRASDRAGYVRPTDDAEWRFQCWPAGTTPR